MLQSKTYLWVWSISAAIVQQTHIKKQNLHETMQAVKLPLNTPSPLIKNIILYINPQ